VASGNRVKTTRVEWVAARYPPATKKDPSKEAILLNRFVSVVRAGWSEATNRGHYPRPGRLIAAYQPERNSLQPEFRILILERSARSSIACAISWKPDIAVLARAMKTTSHPVSQVLDRTASLSILFTRLRTTAFPTRLLTEKPTLFCSRPLGMALITNRRLAQEFPSPCTLAKSLLRVRRSCLLIANMGTKRPETLLYRQPMTARQPSRLQHVSPPPSSHTNSEPVHSLPVQSLGLISPLRHFRSVSRAYDTLFRTLKSRRTGGGPVGLSTLKTAMYNLILSRGDIAWDAA
jgi:hypothetical protein